MAKKTLTTEESAPKQKAPRKKAVKKTKAEEKPVTPQEEDVALPAEPENTIGDVPPADEKPENIDNPPEEDTAQPAEAENTAEDVPPADDKEENKDVPEKELSHLAKAVKRMPLPPRRLSVKINPSVGHDYWFGQSRGL